MADSYLMFSEVVPSITPEERAWLTELLEGDTPHRQLVEAGVDTAEVDPEAWPGFQWEFRESRGEDEERERGRLELWLWAEDSGVPAHVAALVQALLRTFRPGGCWSMTWSETCSKLRVGEFSGGGLFVTPGEATYYCPGDLLRRRHEDFRGR